LIGKGAGGGRREPIEDRKVGWEWVWVNIWGGWLGIIGPVAGEEESEKKKGDW